MSKSNSAPKTSKLTWIGRIISILICLLFTASGLGKLAGGESVAESFGHLEFPIPLATTLAVIELTCVIIYAIPRTVILGSILLTGYMGGAICAHLRVDDLPIPQLVIGMLVWVGVYLREERVRSLIPIRTTQQSIATEASSTR